jgi:hypothetical protein
MPLPTALEAWSPPPPATGVPAGRPVAAAASSVTHPVISLDSYTRGRMPASSFSRSTISVDHFRVTTSNSAVPEASDTSLANSPVSLKRM